MPDHLIIPIKGTGTEVGDIVTMGPHKVEVIGREGIIYDPALGYQVYVSEGELDGIAEGTELLQKCLIIEFKCHNHEPSCEYQVLYRQLE